MKVTMTTLDGETPVETTLRTVRVGDWTFRQADRVEALTGLLPEDILPRIARNTQDYKAATAFAIVAYMLAGKNPEDLVDGPGIDAISVDFSDETDEEAADDSPPVGGGEPAHVEPLAAATSSPES